MNYEVALWEQRWLCENIKPLDLKLWDAAWLEDLQQKRKYDICLHAVIKLNNNTKAQGKIISLDIGINARIDLLRKAVLWETVSSDLRLWDMTQLQE